MMYIFRLFYMEHGMRNMGRRSDPFIEQVLMGAYVSLGLPRIAGQLGPCPSYNLDVDYYNHLWNKLGERYPWCVHFRKVTHGPFIPEFNETKTKVRLNVEELLKHVE